MKCKRCATNLTPHSIGRKKDLATKLILRCRWCEAEMDATCTVCSDPLLTVADRQEGRCRRCHDRAEASV